MVAVSSSMPPTDREKNRFSARAKRYAKVGTKVGTVAARIASQRLVGAKGRRAGRLPVHARSATHLTERGRP